MYIWRSFLSLVLTIITFQSCVIHSCHGFASMFVDRMTSCWVDLRDTKTEVIMNNLIKAPEDSPHGKDVSIELYDNETKNKIDIKKDSNGKNIVYIEDFRENGDEKVTLPFLLKLKVADHPDLADLQYVMDAQVLPEVDDGALSSDASKSRMTAEFTHSSGCDNKRANGKKMGDKGLILNIGIPASIFSLSDVNEQAVDVVAGWACGHEAVTLTESIQFRVMTKGQLDSDKGAKEEVSMEAAVVEEKEETQSGKVDIVEEKKEISRNIRRRHEEEVLEHLHEADKQRRREVKVKPDQNGHLQKLRKLNKLFSKRSSFSDHKYLKGLFVMVVLGGIILKFCIWKGKRTKGRREL